MKIRWLSIDMQFFSFSLTTRISQIFKKKHILIVKITSSDAQWSKTYRNFNEKEKKMSI
jgi:protein involved in sex pheromone biosynthesis